MKDDKIYEMLNDAEIDLKEYEVEELSSEEKERYKTRIRMEVKRMNMETRNKKNKNIRKIAAGMAAACAVAGYSPPVSAAWAARSRWPPRWPAPAR